MRKLIVGLVAGLLLGGATVYLGAQSVSSGGTFQPLEDYTVSGIWTFRGASPIRFEGGAASADDAFELTLAVPNVTADTTLTVPTFGSAAAAFLFSTLATNDLDVVNSVWGVSNGLQFEGATADAFETTLSPTNVGADVTLTMPGLGNVAGALIASTLTTNDVDVANSIWLVSNGVVFEGLTANAFEATVTFADPAADGTLTFTVAGQLAGEQLQTDGAGVLTWEAAASSRAMKHLHGVMTPTDGLAAILAAPVYRFHYKQGQQYTTTGDYTTEYVGILAEDAPWAMHHNGRILNPVNTFGFTVLAIQALEARVRDLEALARR